MDNLEKLNKILDEGLKEIDKDLEVDRDIRDYSTEIAKQLTNHFGRNVVSEYINDEYGRSSLYMFVLLDDVNRNTGTPILRLEVSNMNKVQDIALYNNSTDCVKPAVYTPAVFAAEIDDVHDKLDIVQTLVSTAVSKIMGRFKIEQLDDSEENVTVEIDRR